MILNFLEVDLKIYKSGESPRLDTQFALSLIQP